MSLKYLQIQNQNIDELKEKIYEKLKFIRIYMRPKGGETDFKEPLIAREGDTVEMFVTNYIEE